MKKRPKRCSGTRPDGALGGWSHRRGGDSLAAIARLVKK